MKKENLKWTIQDLQKKIDIIEFPEYQREPSVWDLTNKQKLIDSILRGFDIANIYMNKRPDGFYECIDGRQRINAILSFLGLNGDKNDADNPQDRMDNNFKFVSSDELLGTNVLTKYDNTRFNDFKENKDLANPILNYAFNVIEITLDEDDKDELLNLMFLRLQLGQRLNGGEKLNAMRGKMRDLIFKDLGGLSYFSEILKIPTRRFSKELTASQIALNFFSLEKKEAFKRGRFVDLQEFFKDYSEFYGEDEDIAKKLKKRLDEIYTFLKESDILLKNRAMGITAFFFINKLIENGQQNEMPQFIIFLKTFLAKLKEQVEKGIDIEDEYRDLLKFQNYISQAAVEKYAIENRQKFLDEYFAYYLVSSQIKTTRHSV